MSFFDGYRTETLPANLIQAQRDFFGAHTFRVQPGFEGETTPAGQDIHVKWTATSGNVSTPSLMCMSYFADFAGLIVYLQRLEILLGRRVLGKVEDDIGVKKYDDVLCRQSFSDFGNAFRSCVGGVKLILLTVPTVLLARALKGRFTPQTDNPLDP